MTEEERREMMRSNFAMQMAGLGYDASGNPMPAKEPEPVSPVICGDARTFEESKNFFYACGACGKPLDFCDKFCRNCGKPVKWND